MSAIVADFADLHFLRPGWLLLLALLPALAWWMRAAYARRTSPWQDAVDAHLLPHLLDAGGTARPRAWAAWLGMLAALLAVLAMAGPSWRKDSQPAWHSKAPLVVALDLSGSILANDLPPSRLPQARAKIAALLRERAGGQVALVAFANDAYTVAPLTEDAANVAMFLDALGPDVMPEDGQRVDRAIAWSRRLLQQAGYAQGDILLLTDHADAAAVGAASAARGSGYRVSALGLGTAAGGTFQTPSGMAQARLDAPSLRRLSGSGGGAYAALSTDDEDLRTLGVLDPRADAGTTANGEKIASWRDDGYWLLPLAMLLVLPLFRRGAGVAALLALACLLPMPQARAQDAPVAAPAAGTTGGLWQRPDQAEYARLQRGVAAYRKGEFPQAIEQFSGLDGATAYYNLGNALAKAGRFDDAVAAYDRALQRQPGMADAIANRKAVDAARKRKPPPGDKSRQNQQKQPKPGQPQDKGNDGEQGQGGQDSKPGESQAPPGKRESPTDKGKPEPSPSKADTPQPQDARDQADADAAQRERMQEALRRQGTAPTPGKAPEAKPETPAERERRLANDAQLQRVPDDPGALLRARFRLEYERRQMAGGQ